MVDISFLKSRSNTAGLEYLDFQDKTFYNELVDVLIRQGKTVKPEEEEILGSKLCDVIVKHTGIKTLTVSWDDISGVAAVNTGWFSPNSVLNSRLMDTIDVKETMKYSNLAKWFKENKKKIFTGWVDHKTGRFEGDFQTLPIGMVLARPDITKFLSDGLFGEIAAVLLHEVGHIFAAATTLSETAHDAFITRISVEAMAETDDPDLKVSIINDTLDLLEIKENRMKDDVEITGPIQLTLYLSKMLKRRNTNRSLSLGVQDISCESLADVYAIRMGAGLSMIKSISKFQTEVSKTQWLTLLKFGLMAILFRVLTIYALKSGFIIIGSITLFSFAICYYLMLVLFIGMVINAFFGQYMDYARYESDYRRIRTMMQQMILELKTRKEIPRDDKLQLINDIENAIKIADKNKPLFEGGAWKRMMGWLQSPSDFKFKQMDEYTKEVMNHPINVVNARLELL